MRHEGATVACVDRDRDSAHETAQLVEEAGGTAPVVVGDVTGEAGCAARRSRRVDRRARRHRRAGVQRRHRRGPRARGNVGGRVGCGVRGQHRARALLALPGRVAQHDRRRFDRVRVVGRGTAARHAHPAYDTSKAALAGLSRHIAVKDAYGRARQRRCTGFDRHAARPARAAGSTEFAAERPFRSAARAPRGRSPRRSFSC